MRQRSSLLTALLSTSLLVVGGCQSFVGKRPLFSRHKAEAAESRYASQTQQPATEAQPNWRSADHAAYRPDLSEEPVQLVKLRLPQSMTSASHHHTSEGHAIILPPPDPNLPGPPRVYDLSIPPEYAVPIDPYSVATTPSMIVDTTTLEGSSCPPGGCGNSSCTHCGSHSTGKVHASHHDKKALVNAAGIKPFWKRDNERRDLGKNNLCVPRELRMASHPLYVVEPPDVLYIEALQLLPNRPIAGERLVRQDGTVSLGYYGEMHVASLTLREIEAKLRQRLSRYVRDPQVYVDIASFNSKVYYVLGEVQQEGRLPITGKETVLDAITLAGGLTNFAKIRDIHVARPNPGGGCDQILWVDWPAVTSSADTFTNYQLLPGDRVIVPRTAGAQALVYFDNFLTPIERVVNVFSLLRFVLDNDD